MGRKKSSSMLNVEEIANELGLDEDKTRAQIDLPDKLEVNQNDPESIIRENISRANEILDVIRENIKIGNYSARLFEVAGQLINQISASVEKITQDRTNKANLALKYEYFKLKEKESNIKGGVSGDGVREKIIVTTRDDILKMLGVEKEEPKQIEGNYESD